MFVNLQRPAELLLYNDNNSFCDDEPYSDNEDTLSALSDRKRWIVKIANKFSHRIIDSFPQILKLIKIIRSKLVLLEPRCQRPGLPQLVLIYDSHLNICGKLSVIRCYS